MQLLDGLLALGGDRRNTVPLDAITVAEARALQAIHGDDAVHDVQPLDRHVAVRPRDELARLAAKYKGKDEDGRLIVATLFPNGSGMPQTVEDLGLDESLFRVLSRVTAATAVKRTAPIAQELADEEEEARDPNSADHLFDGDDDPAEPVEDAFA